MSASGAAGLLTRQELEREVQEIHGRYWDDQREAARGKSVVLVEGDDDADLVGAIFRHRKRTWEASVRIVVAGGRSRVLERLGMFPGAHGLVDRDTWSDDDVARVRREYPGLHVTEGWCIENVFLSPRWIRTYNSRVAAALARERERWVRAGALWWSLQRARDAQQRWQDALGWSYGSPHDRLDTSSGATLTATLLQLIPEDVRRGASFDVDDVSRAFEERCGYVLSLDEEQQWRVGVHGKCGFNRLLVPALQAESGQRAWRVELAPRVGRPAPLDELMAILFP